MHDGELIEGAEDWEPTHRITVVNAVTGEKSKPYDVMLPDGEGPAYTFAEWVSSEDALWSFEEGEWQYKHGQELPPDHGLSSTRSVFFEVTDLEAQKANEHLKSVEKRLTDLEDAVLKFLRRKGSLVDGNNLPRVSTDTLIALLSKE